MKENHEYDYAIVGGGIAGVAIAEIFARSGAKVVLLEKNTKLCKEASGSQHGWFHFGSLYSIFPQNHFLKTLVGGVEDLLEFYSDFSGMNIKIDDGGKLVFTGDQNSWFRDEPIKYIVSARNSDDFKLNSFEGLNSLLRKLFFILTWEFAIKQFISRHQRFANHVWSGFKKASEWIPRAGFSNYSRDVIKRVNLKNVNLDQSKHFQIDGFDRPMRARKIIQDLIQSFLSFDGTIKTGFDVTNWSKKADGYLLESDCGEVVLAKKIIFSSGQWTKNFLPSEAEVKIVASPLLVVYPNICNSNFVRLTPFVEKSINHLVHQIDGKLYSVIGGGYYCDPAKEGDIEAVKNQLYLMASSVFPGLASSKLVESYMGYKTEIKLDKGERNYQYLIRDMENGIYVVLPGKFSLSFSLAVNLYRKITGEVPSKKIIKHESFAMSNYVDLMRHEDIAKNAFK